MVGTIRTVAQALLMAFAIPAGGIALLVAAGSGLTLVFDKASRDGGAVTVFAISLMALMGVLALLTRMWRRAQRFVVHVNATEGLQLDPRHLLGHPSPVFMAFDRTQRRFALCNTATRTYRVYGFEHLLGWHTEWSNRSRMELSGAGERIPGTMMRSPSFEHVEYADNFRLVLEVADVDTPRLEFPVSERAAHAWSARLNAIFNG
jgi:hypothetical protein